MITGKNYIGNLLSGNGTKTFRTVDPILNIENDWIFYEASDAEIDEAVRLAWLAFESFKKTSGKEKAEFLKDAAKEIEALGDRLIEVYCKETGLPEGRAKGERGRTVGQLRSFAALVEEGSWVEATIDTAQPERNPNAKPDLRKIHKPLGPVAVFGASNFPLAYSTAGGDTASALAAGCPVIVKSHPMHAGTGELVASALIRAAKNTGMPNGIFSNLNSSGIEVGQKLVQHHHIKAVGFTGSIIGGRALFDMASQRNEPIPVFAEMGSINPVILFPQALANSGDEWAKRYAGSITLGTGQFCTNPGLLLGIKGEALDRFVNALSTEILQHEPTTMLHPNIYEKYAKNKDEMTNQGGLETAADYKGDVGVNMARQAVAKVSGEDFLNNPRLHKEVFGPFSLVVVCDSAQELKVVINNLEGQLTGTVISEAGEISKFPEIVDALQNRVGRLIFNGVPTGVEVCPSMQHGGPYPASTDSRFGAVGIHAIRRWVRPVSYQNWPDELLPLELQNANPLNIQRLVNNALTKKPI